jgi:predicted NUDIX family phosphoesterase
LIILGNKMGREIMGVKRDVLFNDNYFEKGFVSLDEKDFLSLINGSFEYRERNDELEHNREFKQIIPYVWIVNKEGKVFAYKRDKKNSIEYKEKRLHGKWSCGLGGHIDKGDNEENLIFNAMMRELNEEVVIPGTYTPKIIGFFNDDTDSVGEVHFGVLAVVETEGEVRHAENDEVTEEKFVSPDELEEMMENENFESWTKVSWGLVKEYLRNK